MRSMLPPIKLFDVQIKFPKSVDKLRHIRGKRRLKLHDNIFRGMSERQ